MSDMIEVVIDSIRVSLMSQQRIVILRELHGERYLAIWIGVYEAEAITVALQEVEMARPLTWDLLKNALNALGGRVQRVEVVALREETFYGNIVVEANGRTLNIDSRPSDALALSVRVHVPVFVARSIMESAGITPEEDLQEKPLAASAANPPSAPVPGAEHEAGSNRLSIFEDFLDKLDKGGKETPDSEEDQDKE
jgi:hypothetical protein